MDAVRLIVAMFLFSLSSYMVYLVFVYAITLDALIFCVFGFMLAKYLLPASLGNKGALSWTIGKTISTPFYLWYLCVTAVNGLFTLIEGNAKLDIDLDEDLDLDALDLEELNVEPELEHKVKVEVTRHYR